MANSWRIMGLWRGGRVFLIVMGESRKDCAERLAFALSEYTTQDLFRVKSFWYERWLPRCGPYDAEWLPTKEISRRLILNAIEREALGLPCLLAADRYPKDKGQDDDN